MKAFFLFVVGFLLLACAPNSSSNPPANPATVLSTQQVQTTSDQDSEEQAFLGILNAYRAQNGMGPLRLSNPLTDASHWLSSDMAEKNYLDHTDSLNRNPFERMSAFGCRYRRAAENIAAGYETAQRVFEGWRNSPGHNENLLNPSYRAIGIARVYGAENKYGWYWTTDFSD